MVKYNSSIRSFLYITLMFCLSFSGCASQKHLIHNNGTNSTVSVENEYLSSTNLITATPNTTYTNGTAASTPSPVTFEQSGISGNAESKQEKPVIQNIYPQASVSSMEKESILKGKIICIDPGHQSKANYEQEYIAPNTDITKEKMTYGTAGAATGIPEYKLNLAVSLKLRDVLQSSGANVIMTRETHDVNTGNVERAKLANDSKAELVIRIHADGIDNSTVKGVSILYPGKKYLSDNNLLKNSKLAAEKVLNSVVAATGAKSRGTIERDDLTGFNWSAVPVILVEMGFMTNHEEDKLLNSPEYQDKMVEGMVNGIEEYFNSL